MSFDANVIQAIGWSLVHVVWQVTLVALALGAALALLKDRSAQVRYAVSCGALLLAVVLPIATAVSSYDPRPRPQIVAASAPREIFEINGVALQASLRDTFVAAAPKLFNWKESIRSARTSLQPMLPWIVRLWCLGVILFSVRLVI